MPLPPPKEMALPSHEAATALKLRRLLLTLVLVLTFEGLARKLQIPGTDIPIFLLKDAIVLIMGFYLLRMSRPPAIDFLWVAYLLLIVLFLPLIIITAIHDPILALFGAKEYLLYPLVGFAVFFAFYDTGINQIAHFFRWTSLLIIPTTIVALIQIHLPSTHWLNLSVGGADLASFSAAGKLRVSSTFSFVAQYGAFLNAEFFMLVIALNQMRDLKFFWKTIYLSLVPLFVIGNYITGSRGAVVGSFMIVVIAGALSLMKFQIRSTFRMAAIVLGLFFVVMTEQYLLPDEFAAYSGREQGHLIGVSSDIQHRVFGALFDWTGDVSSTPFFGYGLGIMSNGSPSFSTYAAHDRDLYGWTESDFASTLFEGGFYLVLVWYGFRYYVIFQTTQRLLADVHEDLSLPASFSQATVILLGIVATLGIQPPIAIWWWMSVGASLLLWWKCVEPKRNDEGLIVAQPPPPEKKIRGRSAYAERLHGGR
ncbi:MAG: hypothetical protein LV481_06100 [Methylacidiphilales bacterium]|nr:hypothetical protein [Candidatus Methylacidiphilales bacterium]